MIIHTFRALAGTGQRRTIGYTGASIAPPDTRGAEYTLKALDEEFTSVKGVSVNALHNDTCTLFSTHTRARTHTHTSQRLFLPYFLVGRSHLFRVLHL